MKNKHTLSLRISQRKNRSLLRCLVFVVIGSTAFADIVPGVFTVTTDADSGAGSLRQAILDSNNNPPVAGVNTIQFALSGTGVHTIMPQTLLPTITAPLTIDGYTQSGTQPNTLADADNAKLLIEINGAHFTNPSNLTVGLIVKASNTRVRGLVINGYNGLYASAIIVGGSASNVAIEGNFLGTDATGHSGVRNNVGVFAVTVQNLSVGGTNASSRNVITGNDIGVLISGTSDGTVISGNFIGLDATGKATLPLSSVNNDTAGISLSNHGLVGGYHVTNTLIGGTTTGARNFIASMKNGSGIDMRNNDEPGTLANTTIQGNFIGTDTSGTRALGSFLLHNRIDGGEVGIRIGGATQTTIGGPEQGAGNLISGNYSGISIEDKFENSTKIPTTGTIIQGNLIGTQADGFSPLGNGNGGIRIVSSGVIVGGTNIGEANTVAFTKLPYGQSVGHGSGIFVETVTGTDGATIISGTNNAILSNSIFNNSGLGIALGKNTIVPNDPGDTDSGSNNLQNFPVLTSAIAQSGTTIISGSLNSTANTRFHVEFFANSAADKSGYGQGQMLLGSTEQTTGTDGKVAFQTALPVAIPEGPFISATATDPDGNTSEFAQDVKLQQPFQPDNLIKAGRAPFAGKNVYDTDGFLQIGKQPITAGKAKVFQISVRNSGQSTDTFLVKGDGDANGYSVKYLSKGTDITAAVVTGTESIPNVPPGHVAVILAKVTAPSTLVSMAEHSWLVTTTSTGDPTKEDSVKMTVSPLK
jgi:hypothetical protein